MFNDPLLIPVLERAAKERTDHLLFGLESVQSGLSNNVLPINITSQFALNGNSKVHIIFTAQLTI